MKKVLLIMTLLMSFGFSLQQCHEGTGWCFDQQTEQAFYFFHKDAVTFNYEFSSSVLDSGDVIGLFKDDQCVGYYEIDPQAIANSSDVITLPMMGSAEPGDGYLESGEVPSFIFYDESVNITVCANISGVDSLEGFGNLSMHSYHGIDDTPLAFLTGNDQDCDGCLYGIDNNDSVVSEDPCQCQGNNFFVLV